MISGIDDRYPREETEMGSKSRTEERIGRIVALTAMAAVLTVAGAPLHAQSATHKKIDKLVNRAHYVIGSLKGARLQIAATLDEYNSIIDGEATDPRAAYKKLGKEIKRSEKRADDVRVEVERMDQVATKFFGEWEESLADFSSDDLRAKSEERLRETMANYGEILAAGREAGEEFRPFVDQLKDQVVFLGNDLNPDGIAELQDEAKELNEQAANVFEAVDAITRRASDYATALRP
jgi:hypothetical protein